MKSLFTYVSGVNVSFIFCLKAEITKDKQKTVIVKINSLLEKTQEVGIKRNRRYVIFLKSASSYLCKYNGMFRANVLF